MRSGVGLMHGILRKRLCLTAQGVELGLSPSTNIRRPLPRSLRPKPYTPTTIEAEIITNTILEVPSYTYSIMGPKTLLRPMPQAPFILNTDRVS